MKELEKMKRARIYIEKLANGISPIDDRSVSEGDIVNNIHVSRCLFFVSDVLRQVIENGGTEPRMAGKNLQKLPLEIPFEKRRYFVYSKTPITASEIARRVNALIDHEHMQKLTYSQITTWLTEIGMMEWALTSDEKRTKRPTTFGEDNGISVEERTRNNRSYQVVVYNTVAQHFIVDNLDAIQMSENQRAEMRSSPWREEQDMCLMNLYEKSVPLDEIAVILQRNTSAVRSRLKKLGIADPQ